MSDKYILSKIIDVRRWSVLLLIFIFNFSEGQECDNFHKSDACYVYIPLDKKYEIYNQAKSIQVEVQKPVNYKIVLFGGKNYIVGVCAEDNYYRKIHLKIIDGISKKVLFDNKNFDFIESFSFSVDKTQPLDMEVTILSDDKAVLNSKVCVGFQILYCNP